EKMLAPDVRCAGPAEVRDGKRARAGHCSLDVQARSRGLASPLSGLSSSIALAPSVLVVHIYGQTKSPRPACGRGLRAVSWYHHLFAPRRASAGPLRWNADRPSRANGRIPGTATANSPPGSGVSCGRMAAALSALAFSPREPLSVAPRALAQSPSQPVVLQTARAV